MKRTGYSLSVLWLIAASACFGVDTNNAVVAGSADGPLVVMKQAQISGRVFLMSEEEDGGTHGASEVSVIVREPEQAGNMLETKTGENGSFVLPDLEVGEYRLIVARLNLRLRVERPDETGGNKLYIAKTLVIFLPQEMAR